ncbi:MAG: ABC transporter ATP-binding protein [Oscillospiraceae bacterium]|nr:ABC transporter ATP-binding protein [Oscillospiraceae bacterium]
MHGPNRFLTDEEKKNRPKITGKLLKRVFSYLLPYWPKLLLVLAAIVLSSVFGLLPSILTGRIIDEGLIGKDFDMLLRLILLSFAVLLISNLIGVLESYLNTWVAQHITFDMRNQMYAHLQNMSHRFFTTSKQGDVITRMTSDISGVQSVIANTLTSILSNIAVLVTSVIAMYQKNWLLATVGIVIVPLFVLPTKRVGKTRWTLALKSQEKNDEINQILNETLSVSGQMLVKLFTNEKPEYEKYQKANREMTRLNIKESMAGRWFRVAMSTFTSMGPMLIYLVGGLLIIKMGNTGLTVGDITVMVALLSRMYQPVNSLLNIQVDAIRSMALFTRIFDYFDMPVEVENRPDAAKPESLRGDLDFCGVGFSYDPGQEILKDLNFRIEAGHSVAIVGPSGAGKSTIIQLIPRLYDVTEGTITLDGRDIRDMDLETLRRGIGVVTQDTYLFNGTIRENLLYARADATEEQLIEACRKANIHDFIAGLPQGYDTLVGNRGVKLSGGEKQRVSIARVILKDPCLLILDEATSALDSISESLIQDAIDPLLQGHTSLVIAHRLSTIMAADEILVIDQGRIVQRGTHQELVARDGVYRELYETQFRRALEDQESRREKAVGSLG